MLQTIQILGRVFFRAYVIAMLTLLWDNKAFYGLPMGILFGYLSEFENLTKKEVEKVAKKEAEKLKTNQPTFEDNWSDQIPLEIPKLDFETLRHQVEHSLRVGKDMNYGNNNIAGLILSDLKLYIEKNSGKHEVSTETPEYEYEMFFKSESNDFCKIDGWYPIATDRIKNIEKLEEYISNGLLRRIK